MPIPTPTSSLAEIMSEMSQFAVAITCDIHSREPNVEVYTTSLTLCEDGLFIEAYFRKEKGESIKRDLTFLQKHNDSIKKEIPVNGIPMVEASGEEFGIEFYVD